MLRFCVVVLGASSTVRPMTDTYRTNVQRAIDYISKAGNVVVLSGAGMSTAAGIPDFRSPGGLYGTSAMLLDRFTYCGEPAAQIEQRGMLESDVRAALTLRFFKQNPLAYHEMRRGLIIGLGENQWKYTIGHVFPELLDRNKKLQLLASQNIDGLDHKVMSDKRKLYNPHGLMSTLVSEPIDEPLCTEVSSPIYQRYAQLVKDNIKDIYQDKTTRQGRSDHLWPGPESGQSTPITLKMFGDLLPERFHRARDEEVAEAFYSVKPGSVLFDRTLWRNNAAGEGVDWMKAARTCEVMIVMGTSLSGLTIDSMAYSAAGPRIVFDVGMGPVESIGSGWNANDCHLQSPIDDSILDILLGLGWLDQLFDFLPELCLNSLTKLKKFLEGREGFEETLGQVEHAIAAEIEREKMFYGCEVDDAVAAATEQEKKS